MEATYRTMYISMYVHCTYALKVAVGLMLHLHCANKDTVSLYLPDLGKYTNAVCNKHRIIRLRQLE